MPLKAVQVRVSDDQLASWQDAASSSGLSLAEFVRQAVEFRIADRTSKAIAGAVARELRPEFTNVLAEIERMIAQALAATPAAGVPAQQNPTAAVMRRVFDPQCDDSHLHRPGVRCEACGGSY